MARLEAVCSPVGKTEWHANLVLVDDEEMTALNRRFRRKEGLTDVLSFSYLELKGVGEPSLAAGTSFAPVNLWWDPVEEAADSAVGEVALALAFVYRRCRDNAWSYTEELIFLTLHGVLHLLGWEHADPAAVGGMRQVEAELLQREGIRHPLMGRGG
jgi:probable rRNA maturation factor